MPQGQRILLLLAILSSFFAFDANSQCGTLAITGVTTTPVSCNGGSNGTISVQTTGGTGPFTYSNGASTTGPAFVTQPFNSDVISNVNNPTNVFYSPNTCTGGKWFDYQGTGGCPGGTAYYPGSTTIGFTGCYLRTPQADASGLTAVTMKFDISNSYNSGRLLDKITFSIWINNGYKNTAIVPVTVNGVATNEMTFSQSRTCAPVEVVFNISSATLADKSDMLLYINSSCGYNTCSAYWVAIDNVEVLQGGGATSQSSNTFTGLPAGNYPITITDANGCITTYASNPVMVTQPTALSATTAATNPTTVGGSNGKAWVTATGGTPPYTYAWSGGTPAGAGDTITGLSAGGYGVTVTDNNGCLASSTITVNNPACALAITSVGKVNATCAGVNNGSFTITASGASGAVEYSVNGGINWQFSNSFTGLAAGNYTVLVRDQGVCNASASGNPQVISAPQVMSLNFAVTPVSTVGGSNGAINLTVTGGTMPRAYQWSNGATTEDLTNLSAGTYCVTVTDAAGCSANGCTNVTQPTCSLAITSVIAQNPLCSTGNTGSITIATTGANGAVEYSINGGSTWAGINPVSGLTAGSYTVRVRDAAGCTASAASNPYTLVAPVALGGNFVATPVSTAGASNGSIDLTPTGGTTPYTYLWNTGAITQDLSNLPAGNYCVTITDANGCTYNSCSTVSSPGCALAVTNVAVMNVQCSGASNGSITVTTTGGTGQVEYSINGGVNWSANGSFTGLNAGSYAVLVRDAGSCTASASNNPYTLTQPSGIALSTVVANATQNGATDGSINLTASGGTPPYIYVWSTGSTTEDLTGLGAGTYCVTVTDNNNCTATTCGTVAQPLNGCAGFAVTNVAVVQPNCPGESGTITVSISGGQNPILYSVDSGFTFQSGVSVFTVGGGTYNILVQDNNGCQAVYANNPVTINTLLGITPLITQVGDTLYVSDLGVSYQWLFGGNTIANANDTSYTVIANGSYSVVVTDANGCTYTSSTQIVTGVGIAEVSNLEWQLWPNPTANIINYTINTTGARIEIYSTDGRLVLTETVAQPQGQIDMGALSGGVYNIRVVSADGQAIKRIVKY